MGSSENEPQSSPGFHYGSEVPNFPEVSGTSFPLLATVLAGFSVTISVQLILRPDTDQEIPTRIALALTAFLLSTLAMLFSTIFAINAQARNYLPFLDLNERGERLLQTGDTVRWILRIERQWYVYHWAALCSFYGGVVLLLAGLDLIVWFYVGSTMALVFLSATLIGLGATVAVALIVERADKNQGAS